MTAEEKVLQSKRIGGLVVRGYDSQTHIPLPNLFTHDSIPADEDCIPTPSMAVTWPLLKPMGGHFMPKSNCGVGLLHGYNCPRDLLIKK